MSRTLALLLVFALDVLGCSSHHGHELLGAPMASPPVPAAPTPSAVPSPPVWPATVYVPQVPPGAWQRTPAGTPWWAPDALPRADLAAVASEIDATPADRLDAIQLAHVATGTHGAPRGWVVVVMPPGPFAAPYHPPGYVAVGMCDWGQRVIHVAQPAAGPGPDSRGRRLPALGHEYAHAAVWLATGDGVLAAKAGHR